MPVNTFQQQPATASLAAAYRPVILKVEATATAGGPVPPFVSCDVYINDLYYKSLIRTAPDVIESDKSVFIFDISDALQEYLAPDIAAVDNHLLVQATNMSAKVYCKLRASDINTDGFTIEEGLVPVQGTKFTAPVAGDGLTSNTFFVINSSLQHEDTQDLAAHLSSYKKGVWVANAYPLTHRKKYYFCDDCSDHFPLIFSGDCIDADIVLNYRNKGAGSFVQVVANDLNPCLPTPFTNSVIGANTVSVTLNDPLTSGRVFVRYKLKTDTTWTDVGYFTTQTFSFHVYIASDYDLQVIHFCTACMSATPSTGGFTIAASTNLAWRPITTYCIITNLGQPVYISLELRNFTTDEIWDPNNVTPDNHQINTSADLYVKFFSDASLLTPLSLTASGLNVFVKQHYSQSNYIPPNTYYYEADNISTYTFSASGTEHLLANVPSDFYYEAFSTYPTVTSTSHTISVYSPYPDDNLNQGNTGQKGWTTLEQYNILSGAATGIQKPNDPSDPDYVAPVTDSVTCPIGMTETRVDYGASLNVMKVEFRYGSPPQYQYATPVTNTSSGGWIDILPVPSSTDVYITIKAASLVSQPTIKIIVDWTDSSGVSQNSHYTITPNIETLLPGVFQNVYIVNISNY